MSRTHHDPYGYTGTVLESRTIGTAGEANEIFGGKGCQKGSFNVPVLLIPTRRYCCPYITPPSGMYALVQVAGRDTPFGPSNSPVWPAGFHWAQPLPCWQKKISHLVTKQAIVFDTPIRGCKTKDDVTVTIDVCVVFRIMGDVDRGEDPQLVREFVHKLGPSELARQLKDAQDERVRALARSVRHTEVYSLRSHGSHSGASHNSGDVGDGAAKTSGESGGKGLEMQNINRADSLAVTEDSHRRTNEKAMAITDEMKIKLNNQFNKYGVQIIDVAIQKVELPKNFADQMEQRTTYGAEIEEQKQKQMKDMQAVKQREEIETLNQRYGEEQALEREGGKRMEAEVQQKLDNVNAETRKGVMTIREEQKASVLEIKSNCDLKVQKFESETKKILLEWQSRTAAAKDRIGADCDAYCWKKSAEANLVEVQNGALSKKEIAQAEGSAAVILRKKRAFLLQKRQIGMYSALAANKDVVITGKNSGQGMLADLVMSQKQSNILLNVDNKM